MTIEKFHASVQYNDFEGTSAADVADRNAPREWLKKNGYIEADEFLVGISFFAGENHGSHDDPVLVNFFLVSSDSYDNVKDMIDSSKDPIEVRKVSVEMNLTEFFGLFKRFDITLSPYGILEGLTIKFKD